MPYFLWLQKTEKIQHIITDFINNCNSFSKKYCTLRHIAAIFLSHIGAFWKIIEKRELFEDKKLSLRSF